MEKFQNKYRIPSARAQWWYYGNAGIYFITICTRNREHYFGKIDKEEMHLSHLGILADVIWHEITNHAQQVELGEFVVMPNHIHGILILNGNENDTINENGDGCATVETRHALSLQTSQTSQQQTPGQKRFRNQGKNTVSSIIGSYKSAVTKHAHRLGYEFGWQSRMWDSIIFNDESFVRISEYIQTNPLNWKVDKFHPTNGRSSEHS